MARTPATLSPVCSAQAGLSSTLPRARSTGRISARARFSVPTLITGRTSKISSPCRAANPWTSPWICPAASCTGRRHRRRTSWCFGPTLTGHRKRESSSQRARAPAGSRWILFTRRSTGPISPPGEFNEQTWTEVASRKSSLRGFPSLSRCGSPWTLWREKYTGPRVRRVIFRSPAPTWTGPAPSFLSQACSNRVGSHLTSWRDRRFPRPVHGAS